MPRRMTPAVSAEVASVKTQSRDRVAEVGHDAGRIEHAQPVRGEPAGFEVVGRAYGATSTRSVSPKFRMTRAVEPRFPA